MVYKIADNILSPLGETTAQNYQTVKSGRSALRTYECLWQLPRPFSASLFTEAQREAMATEGLTPFESMVVCSVRRALQDVAIDITQPSVVLILSTTKANVDLLTADGPLPESLFPGQSARRIARYLGFTTEPIVVCNACISGVAALLLASRLLEAGNYDYAVVCGADCQSRFIVSGFQSFQVVSPVPCRPFDMERMGLSLGEAAATMVLSRRPEGRWALVSGAIRNDACHISAPAKHGEGAAMALRATLGGFPVEQLAFVNAHGTATMFNDQMESLAIEQAGLSVVPVNGYKGYYGHTMGAAGVLETVLSMAALDDHTILGTRGFQERGVSGKIQLSATAQATDKQAFVKLLSGFGGGNAALLVTGGQARCERLRVVELCSGMRSRPLRRACPPVTPVTKTTHHVQLIPGVARLDGRGIPLESVDADMLTALYRQHIGDYPKYYKMDRLSQLGFVASELLLQAERRAGDAPVTTTPESTMSRAVILFCASSSVHADRRYLASIAEPDNFFPSPSVFVYTLPNIVAGEIAIRNNYHGETSFYILSEPDARLMQQILAASCLDAATESVLCGWIDYQDDDHYVADLSIEVKMKE